MKNISDYLEEHAEDDLVAYGFPQILKGRVLRELLEEYIIVNSVQCQDKLLIQLSNSQVTVEIL